jgi:hypothetical protein
MPARPPELHFLPWAGNTKTITIGPVAITPWTTLRKTLPAPARTFLNKYFSRYRTNDNKPIQNISIASIGTNPLQALAKDQHQTIRRAVDALTLTSIIPTLRKRINVGHGFPTPTSERFQLVIQNVVDYTGRIGIVAAGITHLWSINQIHLTIPWHVGGDTYDTDEALLTALGKLLGAQRHKRLRERIFRTIEWFRLSRTGSSETSDASRLVMKATAFEVLLQPADPTQKRRLMREALQKLTDQDTLKRTRIWISTHKKTGKRTYVTVNPIAAFFDTLYRKRNKIVHGEKVTTADFIYEGAGRKCLLLDVADLVLCEAIIWELVNHRLLGGEQRRAAHRFSKRVAKLHNAKATTPSGASDALIKRFISSSLNLTPSHRTLGWSKFTP